MLIRTGHPPERAGPAPAPPGTVFVSAPAKVNLFLEVLGKRPDGYHVVCTLVLAVELFDDLEFAPTDVGEVTLTCDVPELSTGPDNLVRKAADLLKRETGCQHGASIRLVKRIPWAAGLGGGSSDAAATLVGLNALWELGLTAADLSRLAATLGSDVPFFLNGSAALCTGRGEIVTPVPVGRAFDLVFVKPADGLATADVYRQVRVPAAPRTAEAAVAALAAGDVDGLAMSLHNRLQEPAFELSPATGGLHRRLRATAAAGALLSGSGSCLFALCRNPSEARQVVDDLSRGAPLEGGSLPRIFSVRSCS